MGKTSIAWSQESWNPLRGCSPVSPGCARCYAGAMASRFAGVDKHGKEMPFTGYAVPAYQTSKSGGGRWTGRVDLLPEKLSEPLRWRKPRKIFVNSMSDLFHEALDFEEIAAVFGVMAACPQHVFQVLTKRAERMAEFFRWVADCAEAPTNTAAGGVVLHYAQKYVPGEKWTRGLCDAHGVFERAWPLPNVHLGVSAEDQKRWDERVPELLKCPAAVRWVSLEPQISAVSLCSLSTCCAVGPKNAAACRSRRLQEGHSEILSEPCPCRCHVGLPSWVVQGGESGPGARPFRLEWMYSMRDACREAGVAWFPKQTGSNASYQELGGNRIGWPTPHHRAGEDQRDWPADLQGCREWPS